MNKYIYYAISLVLLSWVLPIPFVSKFTTKFKPKVLKPALILLLGFVGGSMAADAKECALRFSSSSWSTIWLSRLVNTLTFGLIKF